MSAEEIGKAFVEHYYLTFDTARPNLASLYQPQSNMSWEGESFSGQQAIIEKLNTLPQVSHFRATLDIQPTINSNAILIFVTGKLQIDQGNPLHFTQVFQLVSHQPGAYYVHNDIFRLNYG